MSTVEYTPEAWMFDEDGTLIRDEKVFHSKMNEYYREKYGGLSRPILGLEIFDMPDPEWALKNLIQQEGITMLHGSPGAGKSLLAMDWAYTLASPDVQNWMGQPKLRNYKPMYIFTEGLSGLKPRSLAWSLERGVEVPGDDNSVMWVRDAVRLNRTEDANEPWSEQVAALFQMYNDYDRDILFIDTLANTFGGNENSQQDANNYLAALRMFQQGGPVVVVHHNTKDGDDYRGSTVLEGAVDTKVAVKENRGIIHLYITKQKDGDPGFNLDLKIKPHSWESFGRELTSVSVAQTSRIDKLTSNQERVLDIIRALGDGATAQNIADIREASLESTAGILSRMQDGGFVDKDETTLVWRSLVDEPEEL